MLLFLLHTVILEEIALVLKLRYKLVSTGENFKKYLSLILTTIFNKSKIFFMYIVKTFIELLDSTFNRRLSYLKKSYYLYKKNFFLKITKKIKYFTEVLHRFIKLIYLYNYKITNIILRKRKIRRSYSSNMLSYAKKK
jgi:hypothetical protein